MSDAEMSVAETSLTGVGWLYDTLQPDDRQGYRWSALQRRHWPRHAGKLIQGSSDADSPAQAQDKLPLKSNDQASCSQLCTRPGPIGTQAIDFI